MTQKSLPEDFGNLSIIAGECAPRFTLTSQQRFTASSELSTAASLLDDPGEDDATCENSYALAVDRIRAALLILTEDTKEAADDAR